MDIHQATEAYETWLGKWLTLIPRPRGAEAPADGGKPIPVPAGDVLPLGATMAEGLPRAGRRPGGARRGRPAHGELRHLARRGGAADLGHQRFDEAYPMPYTNDLVRLAASAMLAIRENHLSLDPHDAWDAILDGYWRDARSPERNSVQWVLGEAETPKRRK